MSVRLFVTLPLSERTLVYRNHPNVTVFLFCSLKSTTIFCEKANLTCLPLQNGGHFVSAQMWMVPYMLQYGHRTDGAFWALNRFLFKTECCEIYFYTLTKNLPNRQQRVRFNITKLLYLTTKARHYILKAAAATQHVTVAHKRHHFAADHNWVYLWHIISHQDMVYSIEKARVRFKLTKDTIAHPRHRPDVKLKKKLDE